MIIIYNTLNKLLHTPKCMYAHISTDNFLTHLHISSCTINYFR